MSSQTQQTLNVNAGVWTSTVTAYGTDTTLLHIPSNWQFSDYFPLRHFSRAESYTMQ